MSKTMDLKDLKEAFRSFLVNLDVFLDSNSVYQDAKIQVLFIQEPQQGLNELYVRGLVKIDQFAFPIEVSLDTQLESLRIDSQIFHYHLTLKDMLKFIKEHRGGM